MKQELRNQHHNSLYTYFIRSTKGNALPLVLMLILVVMLVGGSVAYSTMQMFTVTRDGYHDQLAYIAAETALEKSIANLQDVITVTGYPGSRGVFFSGNVDIFLNSLIAAINADSAIYGSYTIEVSDSLNDAIVDVDFQRYGTNYVYTGDRIRFPVQITASSNMEDETFSSYGRKAVAVREYEIPVYTKFTLNGAIYTLGDLLVKGGDSTADDYSNIQGDVYVFGTGLDETNRMQQYYNGGVCATDDSILHIENGSIFTRNLVRAGTFDDSDGAASSSSSIIVDEDVVAQGIQVFGSNDNIVVTRDVFTFDDVEMNGANSVIAINGNFFGLNPGDGSEHDNSSGMVNIAPMYGTAQAYQESRIAVNGNIYANGVTFRVFDDDITGETEAGHKMESVSMVWRDGKPLHIKELIDDEDQDAYLTELYDLNNTGKERNGFSILWKADWEYDSSGGIDTNWELWKDWVTDVREAANYQNNNGNPNITIPSATAELQGYSNYGISANNTFYKYDRLNLSTSDIKGSDSISINVVNKVAGLGSSYIHYLDLDQTNWLAYNSEGAGLPAHMKSLMDYLQAHVSVFSSKTTSTGEYNYNYQMATPTQTEFNRIKAELSNTTVFSHDPYNRCVVRYDYNGGVVDSHDLNDELVTQFDTDENANTIIDPEESYQSFYFLVVNLNPNNEVRITDTFNGIIFSLGKVIVEKDASVNGAIIAAGRGFDDDDSGDGLEGSAADMYDGTKTRLPRVVIGNSPTDLDTVSNFTSWKYAAIEIENGGDIYYPGNTTLLTLLKNNIDVGITNRSIDLFTIFNVEVSP